MGSCRLFIDMKIKPRRSYLVCEVDCLVAGWRLRLAWEGGRGLELVLRGPGGVAGARQLLATAVHHDEPRPRPGLHRDGGTRRGQS